MFTTGLPQLAALSSMSRELHLSPVFHLPPPAHTHTHTHTTVAGGSTCVCVLASDVSGQPRSQEARETGKLQVAMAAQ